MSEPTKTLPTNRVSYEKQKEILKAFAISGVGGKVATNKEVAEIVGLPDATVRYTNDFFSSVGFLRDTTNGFFVAPELCEYHIAEQQGEANAFYRISPLLEKTWFAKALLPKLQLKPMPESGAITHLSITCSAEKEYRGRVKMILRYMEDAGVIKMNGTEVTLGSVAGPVVEEPPDEPKVFKVVESKPLSKSDFGGVRLDFSIQVDSSEFSKWSPERISAFFNGLAQVLAAKANLENNNNE